MLLVITLVFMVGGLAILFHEEIFVLFQRGFSTKSDHELEYLPSVQDHDKTRRKIVAYYHNKDVVDGLLKLKWKRHVEMVNMGDSTSPMTRVVYGLFSYPKEGVEMRIDSTINYLKINGQEADLEPYAVAFLADAIRDKIDSEDRKRAYKEDPKVSQEEITKIIDNL